MLNGLPPGSMPEAYSGGMTARGVSNLYDFVARGGTLVTMDRAAELPLTTFGLPIRNVTAGVRETDFFVPGSILKISVDPSNPVAYGMPPEAAAFFINSPAFSVGRRVNQFDDRPAADPVPVDTVRIVARYPGNDVLMSGWMLGPSIGARRTARTSSSSTRSCWRRRKSSGRAARPARPGVKDCLPLNAHEPAVVVPQVADFSEV
ncbi:MAG: hypothetical protein DMF93_01160 [Acidobacteria bacterium]|nr:MAG: hypothetical protein DMF93_01160 [Acidobacteriota bacterium]